MKKVFDQTVRDLKREVNKKVLKVPGIEQKVLDATSNEPWGPHGSLLADIAVATRNYHEYQMIMTVIWKRLNDTGKNWRHVYKALLVLEYLVANGSERVIDEIREHAYQIATLSEFQYIDSSGRDQGNNVRRKSQSLVALVNDKEQIIEARQKAAANREKFRSTPSGGMYRPGAGGYGDRYDDDRYEGRYGSREEDRNGYGKEREWGYKDDDRYGRYSDPYSRDGDRYGREYEDRYGRDSYREGEFRGRSQSVDDGYRHGSRSRSSDRDKERSFDDPYSSRGSGARADENSQDGRKIERNFSEQNIGAPPSYEEVVSESRSPAYSERDAEASAASAPSAASPPANNQPAPPPPASNHPASSPPPSHHSSQSNNVHSFAASPAKHEVEAVDAFDPRGPVSAIPVTNNAETDLLGSLSHALAVVPTTSVTSTYEVESHVNSGSIPSSSNISQPFEDPFGEGPFKAVPSGDATQMQPQVLASSDPSMNQIAEPQHGGAQKADMGSNFGFGDTLSGLTFSTSDISTIQSCTNSESLPQELSATHKNTDILADILPPSQPAFSGSGTHPGQPSVNSFGTYEVQPGAIVPVNMAPQTQSSLSSQQGGGNFLPHGGSTVPGTSHMVPQVSSGPPAHFNNGNFIQQGGYRAPQNGNFCSQQVFNSPNHGNFYAQGGSTIPMTPQMGNQSMMGQASQFNGGNFLPPQGSTTGVSPQVAYQAATGPASPHSNNMLGNIASQTGSSTSMAPQQAKDKFEPKSAVWADTLSRGLVNLNISGPKTNPLSDIGIDFDALNRKEKRMEKQPAQTSVTSTMSMGKAMGSGTGLGRAGAGALRPQANTMETGMGGGSAMGGYGGMSQPMGGMGMGMGARMGMNMGMRQGVPMQMPSGYPPSSTMPGFNPMMGLGGYGQQPYGGYR